MGRAGRKRKQGVQRQPDGSIRSYENPKAIAQMQHVKRQLEGQIADPRWQSPLGRLAISSYLTSDEYDAAVSWAALTWRYGQIIGLKMPMCKAISWEGAVGRSLATEPDQEEIERVKALKARADALIRSVSERAMQECVSVIIGDEAPTDRVLLRAALRALTDAKKSRNA